MAMTVMSLLEQSMFVFCDVFLSLCHFITSTIGCSLLHSCSAYSGNILLVPGMTVDDIPVRVTCDYLWKWYVYLFFFICYIWKAVVVAFGRGHCLILLRC